MRDYEIDGTLYIFISFAVVGLIIFGAYKATMDINDSGELNILSIK